MVRYDQFNAEMRECFEKLPKLAQESIIQANVEVTSLSQLESLAGSLSPKNQSER